MLWNIEKLYTQVITTSIVKPVRWKTVYSRRMLTALKEFEKLQAECCIPRLLGTWSLFRGSLPYIHTNYVDVIRNQCTSVYQQLQHTGQKRNFKCLNIVWSYFVFQSNIIHRILSVLNIRVDRTRARLPIKKNQNFQLFNNTTVSFISKHLKAIASFCFCQQLKKRNARRYMW